MISLIEKMENLPEIIDPSFVMDFPNQSLEIFSGKYSLRFGDDSLEVTGRISFDWFPDLGVKFTFNAEAVDSAACLRIYSAKQVDVFVTGFSIGQGYLQNVSSGNDLSGDGRILKQSVFGDKSISVSKEFCN